MNQGKKEILLSHGSGGKLSRKLIEELFLPKFANPILSTLSDSALFNIREERLALTTDSYVVKPLFFPGGDIGRLAIFGTVNDLAVMGAQPLYISCGLILEEGLELSLLEKIVQSMQQACQKARVQLITGDIKVVEKGSADKLFINTSGIGIVKEGVELSTQKVKIGDRIILSGSLGDHGMAVLSQREGFQFHSGIKSDCAPLNGMLEKVLSSSREVHFMRDPTRGGLATTLNELAQSAGLGIIIEEDKIPVHDEVKGFCELLGFDPLYIANEGKVVVVVDPQEAEKICALMRAHPLGRESQIIGEVVENPQGKVALRTAVGGTRIVDMLVGEQLPRIC